LIKLNGTPIELVRPEILRYKVFEPILLLGRAKFANIDIRIRVKGGGYTAQIYGMSCHAKKLFLFLCLIFLRSYSPGNC
jgi:ribosomal protein S9